MLLKLANFMGVQFRCQVEADKTAFSRAQLDFTVSKQTQTASEYYSELSSNVEALKTLGLASGYEFLRFQTKQLWYKDISTYHAPALFTPEYNLWFAKQLNKLFDDEANTGNWSKAAFLTAMFSELKQMIIKSTADNALLDIFALQNSNPLVKDTLNNNAN